MSVKDLLAEACLHLAGVTKLTREDMRLAGYPDSMSESTRAQAASDQGMGVGPDKPRASAGFGSRNFSPTF
jgi:hypothetical protein